MSRQTRPLCQHFAAAEAVRRREGGGPELLLMEGVARLGLSDTIVDEGSVFIFIFFFPFLFHVLTGNSSTNFSAASKTCVDTIDFVLGVIIATKEVEAKEEETCL